MNEFTKQYASALSDFSRLSRDVGARRDFVQGGGGNTSVKLDEHLMAAKGSGLFLGDVLPDPAYAVMDNATRSGILKTRRKQVRSWQRPRPSPSKAWRPCVRRWKRASIRCSASS